MQDYLLFNKFIMTFALLFLFWAGLLAPYMVPGRYIPRQLGLDHGTGSGHIVDATDIRGFYPALSEVYLFNRYKR